MFKLENNKAIGKYLSRLINKKYPSVRQFGKACIEEDGRVADNEEMRKASNRLSQILKGTKSVQISDLPIFAKLLDVSCEEILSAGKCHATTANHLTNYSIVTSKDPKSWDAYVKREDKLILNADEYGKTVIDYALDFENYEFLKFLMDNEYIWFVGVDEQDLFHYGFGAGTSIERNPLLLRNLNVLETKMNERYELRMKMIVLAIKNEDTQMLAKLHAREIPPLYQACLYFGNSNSFGNFLDADLISAFEHANDEILDYFSDEFEIIDDRNRANRFMFPFISELIDTLLITNNEFVEWVLKKAIKHNQYIYDRLSELLQIAVNDWKKIYCNFEQQAFENSIKKGILEDIYFYDDNRLIKYYGRHTGDVMVSNLVRVSATSDSTKMRHLIQELNDLYDKTRNITPIL
jgi:ankyrin repeat protein